MKKSCIGIIGAGPIGAILGVHLAAAGEKIAFVDINEEHLAAIRSRGLTVSGVKDIHVVVPDAVTDVRLLKNYDLEYVFISVKSTVTNSILEPLAKSLGPKAAVICLQNGLYAEEPIAKIFGADRVLRVVINYAGFYEAPGKIRFTFFQKANRIGALSKAGRPAAEAVARRLSASGMATEVVDDIHRYDWEKVILNVILGPICAIVGKTMKDTLACEGVPELSDNLLGECIAVAKAEGYEWDEGFYERCRKFVRDAGAHKPSMLVDVEAGRKTEIDLICGKMVEYGRKHGIPTPHNETIATLVNALGRRR